jgi:hypothetical protein
VHELPDAAGEMSYEASDRFVTRLAHGLPAGAAGQIFEAALRGRWITESGNRCTAAGDQLTTLISTPGHSTWRPIAANMKLAEPSEMM